MKAINQYKSANKAMNRVVVMLLTKTAKNFYMMICFSVGKYVAH
jgi:hypothetical protein